MQAMEFHHVGVAVRNLSDSATAFRSLLGYEIVSGPFDDPIQKVSVCFLSRGGADPWVELVAPLGQNSPVDRILKRGGGTYHLCYQVQDIQATIRHMVAQRSILISGPTPAVAFEMRSIAWLMTRPGLLVELVQAPAAQAL
jgi:methylmalonyl-CoA/ethylmalonyl-CoA epimerase